MASQLMQPTQGLLYAQNQAEILFTEIENRQLIQPGRLESEINQAIYDLAFELFGIRKYWHKRIVRAGANTLYPYKHNPPDIRLQEDDIAFLDFGPVFEEWEADYGQTYVLGNDPVKLKLKRDTDKAFEVGKKYYREHQAEITASGLYRYMCQLAENDGWEFGGHIAGHIVGRFPHERIEGDGITHYICQENDSPMHLPGKDGEPRHWILEIHFIDRQRQIGAFVEALLSLD